MRVLLTYLMLILFVGSHWLADLTPHFHDDTENSASIESSAGNHNAIHSEDIESVSVEVSTSSIFDDCCANADQVNAASDISCMADCGLIASNYQPYRPNPGLELSLPANFPAASNTVSNPFRPPIA